MARFVGKSRDDNAAYLAVDEVQRDSVTLGTLCFGAHRRSARFAINVNTNHSPREPTANDESGTSRRQLSLEWCLGRPERQGSKRVP
jgi:hypothetical protein